MDYAAIRDYLPIGSEIVIRTAEKEIAGSLQVITESALGLRKTNGSLFFIKLELIDDLTITTMDALITDEPIATGPVSGHADMDSRTQAMAASATYANPKNFADDVLVVRLPTQDPEPAPRSIDHVDPETAPTLEHEGDLSHAESGSVVADSNSTMREFEVPSADSSHERDDTGPDEGPPRAGELARSQSSTNPVTVLEPSESIQDEQVLIARIASATVEPVDWDAGSNPANQQQLQSIRSVYEYAVKVKEVDPKFGRIQTVSARLYELRLRQRNNAGLLLPIAQIEILKGDPRRALFYLARSAGNDAISERVFRTMLIASAQLGDSSWIIYVGFQAVQALGPQGLGNLARDWFDYLASRKQLGVLRYLVDHGSVSSQDISPPLVQLIRDIPPSEPDRPADPQGNPIDDAPRDVIKGRPRETDAKPARNPVSVPSVRSDDPYVRAHAIEHRGGDLEEAKRLYREAIAKGYKRESRVKDLAWLVRRTEGPSAALKVIEEEYPDALGPSDALDNILIDFLYGAERYEEAVLVINRQQRRNDLSYERRNVLQHLRASIKLRLGEDSVEDWIALTRNANDAYARRGLALAYLLRGGPPDLDSAEMVLGDDADVKAQDIREQIARARKGLSSESAIDIAKLLDSVVQPLAPPLIDFVTNNYSQQAKNYIEQRTREGRRAHPLDAERLARNANHLRGLQRENSADGYISAAVIVRDKLDRTGPDDRASDEYRQYLVQGLVALADVMLDRESLDSARDLYATALSVSESIPHAESMADVKYGFARYFVSLDGRRALARVRGKIEEESLDDILLNQLRYCYQAHGQGVFDLVVRLFAISGYAGRRVEAAISKDPELAAGAKKFLRSGIPDFGEGPRDVVSASDSWIALARLWLTSQREVVGEILSLQSVEMSDESLQSAISVLARQGTEKPFWISQHISSLTLVLQEFRRSIYETTFEERETCFRRAQERMNALLSEIQRAPTQFAVESLVPVAERIKRVAESAMQALLADSAPEPALSSALDTVGTDPQGRLTFQVKISNSIGRAPIESPTLSVLPDDEVFSCLEPRVTLKTAIPGGDKLIVVLKLEVTDRGRAEGAFSVALELEYRSRGSSAIQRSNVTLPVQLSTSTFVDVDNPYREGSLGRPVGRAEMFYGRDDLLERISSRFRAVEGGGSAFAIYGQKRAGKSSIRIRLAQVLGSVEGVVVIDLGNMGKLAPSKANASLFVGSLCWQIVKIGHRELLARGLTGLWESQDVEPRASLVNSPTPIVDCLEVFADYKQSHPELSGLRFLLIFDEFQYFDSWIRAGLVDPSFMQGVKAIIESNMFDLMIVGLDALDRLFSKHPNIFAVFARERVTYLEEFPARLLIDEPIRIGGRSGSSRYRESAVERILDLTGGSAFYIQKFCYELVLHMNAYRASYVTEADVDIVRQQLLARLDLKDFDNLESSGYVEQELAYTGADAIPADYYKQVLLALAVASREGPVRIERIHPFYSGNGDLELILDDLVGRDVVRKEAGRYRIVVRLYQDWLLFHQFGGATSGDEP